MDPTQPVSAAYQFGQIIGFLLMACLMLALPAAAIVGLVMMIKTKKKAWLFLLVPCGLLALLFIGLLGTGIVMGINEAWKTRTGGPGTAMATHVVKSPDGLIRMDVPGNWKPLTQTVEGAQLQLGSPVREEYMLVFDKSKTDIKLSLEDLGQMTVDNIKEAFSGLEISDGEKVTINGFKAVQYQVTGTVKGVNLAYLISVIETPESFHQILMWTLRSKKDVAFPVFRRVLDSFALNKEGVAAEATASPAK